MKDRKKPRGTKARVQAYKKRLQRIAIALTVTVILVVTVVSGFFIYSFLNSSPNQIINGDQNNNPPFQLKAAIVDHLSLTTPNQTFIDTATNILEQAGYTVDYYPGEEVTIEFYRNLPTHGYRLIILRVHAVLDKNLEALSLFTSEPYNTAPEHLYEILADRLTMVAYTAEDVEKGDTYFGISPFFVTLSMKGQLPNSTVIMMGCNGLTHQKMAKAFTDDKNAKVYISWSKTVQASHTDQATINLLKHLILEKKTIEQAVENTMKEVGPDPDSEALLTYYPPDAGDQTIENTTDEN